MTFHDHGLERPHTGTTVDNPGCGTVLLIDGHGTVRIDVRRQLAARYRLMEAADATAGLRLACRLQPDLVICSADVPEHEGYVPCRAAAAVPVLSVEDRIFLERTEEVVEENLGDDGFGTAALVRKLATSRTQLYRRLRRLTGRSPADLIVERRLERAARWIAEGIDSVSGVAFKVGFKSVSHFSRRFKQRYGFRPSALLVRSLAPPADILGTEDRDGNTCLPDRDARTRNRDVEDSTTGTGSLV